MKLQIACDFTDLEQAVETAGQVEPYCDVLEIGTLLLYSHGIKAVERFRATFPTKTILVDTKLLDRSQQTVPLMAQAGADWITVMAGSPQEVIHAICKEAARHKIKVLLDLLDAPAPAQIAMDAKNLGAHAVLFHQAYDAQASLVLLDAWNMVKENASLPVLIAAPINRTTIGHIIDLQPEGIVIGNAIIEAEDPVQEAAYYHDLIAR